MPRLYPAGKLRLLRLQVGQQLAQMSVDLGYSISMLSNVERGLVDKPEIAAAMKAYLAKLKLKTA